MPYNQRRFGTRPFLGNNFQGDIGALIGACYHEAGRLDSLLCSGRAGDRARGRTQAFKQVAVWLQRIPRNSLAPIDLATNLHDFALCLQKSQGDEEEDAAVRPVSRRRRGVNQGKRWQQVARARGKASAYADVQDALCSLLALYYEGLPLTWTANEMSYDEWQFLAEPDLEEKVDEGHKCFVPLSPEAQAAYGLELLMSVRAALSQDTNPICSI